jgi:carbonic anhydrase
VMVLGHTRCGAVAATVDAMLGESSSPSTNIGDIVERIRPAVQEVLRPGLARDQLLVQAVRANVRSSVRQLRAASRMLEQLMAADRLTVVGAEYALETGEVRVLD